MISVTLLYSHICLGCLFDKNIILTITRWIRWHISNFSISVLNTSVCIAEGINLIFLTAVLSKWNLSYVHIYTKNKAIHGGIIASIRIHLRRIRFLLFFLLEDFLFAVSLSWRCYQRGRCHCHCHCHNEHSNHHCDNDTQFSFSFYEIERNTLLLRNRRDKSMLLAAKKWDENKQECHTFAI